jgi:hypothetical protein
MKKLALVFISSLLLSACGPQNTPPATPVDNGQASSSAPQTAGQTILKTISDVISLGTAQKCTWQSAENGDSLSGEMLIDGSRFKQTIVFANDSSRNVYALSDGQWVYTWSPQMSGQGIKIPLPKSDSADSSNPQNPQSFDFNKEYDFNCSPATVNAADFAVPSDIEFADLSNLGIPNLPQGR